MKVGTDGVLIGAWTDVSRAHRVLDIGTGTGLIALMIAQRCDAEIIAVDIDPAAVIQARGNVSNSPWTERIEVVCRDIRELPKAFGLFDVIVSNPPYFTEGIKCPIGQRNTARHTDGLSFSDLLCSVKRLLAPGGCFSVILPAVTASDFIGIALHEGLHLKHRTWVHTKPGIEPKRVLMDFGQENSEEAQAEHLVIETEHHVYSSEFTELVKDYYLAIE